MAKLHNPGRVIPGHAYARLTRFVATLPGDVLCEVDPVTNVCTVNQALYDSLKPHQQRQVWSATGTIVIGRPVNDNEVFGGFDEAVGS